MKKIFITLFSFILVAINYNANSNDLNKAYRALEIKDYSTAIYFFSYYANIGDAKSQYNYGIMLKKGLGTKKDENEAFKWLFLSAEQGNILANYALGNAYYRGEGVEINYKLSYQSYLKSSILGHPAAKINLGNLYYQGKGTSKSYEKAMLWWMLAESQNINGAKENLKMLDNVISETEKQRGLSLYNKCLRITLLECSKLQLN